MRQIKTLIFLAFWRLRQNWNLLLLIGIGMIVSVTLVCIIPLYTLVATSAGVRGAFITNPEQQYITINGAGSPAFSFGVIAGVLLSFMAVPVLVFTCVAPGGLGSKMSGNAFFLLQSVPPIQVILPFSLALIVLLLLAFCAITLSIVIRQVIVSVRGGKGV